MNAPDLTQRPPRSPRVRLGGYTILPRLLDKARAVIAGTAGEYKYNNPNDGHFFRFTGLAPEALLAQVKSGLRQVRLDQLGGEIRRGRLGHAALGE